MIASVLLAARDQAPALLRALSALARLGEDAGLEAVVVDDGSQDGTAALLSGIEGDFQALSGDGRGWGLAIDRAVAAARGEHLILLREDAVPVDGWFGALLGALDADPDAGAVRATAARLDGSVLEDDFACLAVRREAFAAVGGFAGTGRPGRPERATFLAALRQAGYPVTDAAGAVVLVLPEA